jgi:biotin carboxyl carrier protein
VQYEVDVNGRVRQVEVQRVNGQFVVSLDGEARVVDAVRLDEHSLSLVMNGESVDVSVIGERSTGQLTVLVDGVTVPVTVNGQRRFGRQDMAAGGGPQRVVAPMSGKIVRVMAGRGAAVERRQPLIVIEAMKMENELRATHAGVVSDVHVKEGDSVEAGALLLVVLPS